MRLIDADAIDNDVLDAYGLDNFGTKSMLDEQPTIDAVQVIRCKDCKFWQDNNGGYPNMNCRWIDDETPDADDYCSYAERKEE